MTGLYASIDEGTCVECGHPARSHERFGIRKACLVPRCRCRDLEEPR